MKKGVILFGLILLLSLTMVSCDGAKIIITAPPNGAVLIKGNPYTIQWTHTDYFDLHPQTCVIFCGSFIISTPVPVTQDFFVWTAGRKADGDMSIPLSHFEITIESDEYDALNGPYITLIAALPQAYFLPSKLLLAKTTEGPLSFTLDLQQLGIKPTEAGRVELFVNGRQAAKLGRFEPGRMPAVPAKVVLKKSDVEMIRKGAAGFELRLFSQAGKLIQVRPVALEIGNEGSGPGSRTSS